MAGKHASAVYDEKAPQKCETENLREYLMTWTAAIYCTLGVQDIDMAELPLTLV